MQASTHINLEKVRALIVSDNAPAVAMLTGVLGSFGLRERIRKANGKEAVEELKHTPVDLILTDADMPEMDGYGLIHWLRHNGDEASRMTPAFILSAHTRRSQVVKARDCGANFIIAKPISPVVILERILWVARGDRAFVECDVYVGPDRRWRHAGPPVEHADGRRRHDKSLMVGEPESENLTQDELDQLVRPQRHIG